MLFLSKSAFLAARRVALIDALRDPVRNSHLSPKPAVKFRPPVERHPATQPITAGRCSSPTRCVTTRTYRATRSDSPSGKSWIIGFSVFSL